MYANAISDCDLGNSKEMAPTEQLAGGPSKARNDARSRAWRPKEIKSADGQVRLSSVYGRSAVLE
jgi:hypothetical protein